MNLSDIRHLFDYTEWANDLAMEAADELLDADLHRETGISHGSIFGTLTHMAGAEWIWLERCIAARRRKPKPGLGGRPSHVVIWRPLMIGCRMVLDRRRNLFSIWEENR